MMKKDHGKLKKGDCFIRKGSTQSKMTRQDLDKIIKNKFKDNDFSDKIQIYFNEDEQAQEIELTTVGELEYPSEKAREKIQKIIEMKKSSLIANSFTTSRYTSSSIFGEIPYEQRSVEELEKNLEDLEKDYYDEDNYYLLESKSQKINLTIMNLGKAYIEDAAIQVRIDKTDGILIPEEIYPEPQKRDAHSLITRIINNNLYNELNYPKIEYKDDSIIIADTIGNIKHLQPINAFEEPIRILLGNALSGKVIQLNCKLFGKNLKEPFETILKIRAIPNEDLPKE